MSETVHWRKARMLLRPVATGALSRVLRLAIVLLLFGSIGVAVAVLRAGAERAHDAAEIASELHAGINELDALAWRSIAVGAVSPTAGFRLSDLGASLFDRTSELDALIGRDAELGGAMRVFSAETAAYSAAMADEMNALMSGQVDRAAQLQRTRTSPAFAALERSNATIEAALYERAHHRRLLADVWSVVLFVLAFAFALALYAGSRRFRQRAALREAHAASVALSEERFRRLVQSSSDAILVVDPDGCIRTATGAVERTLALEPDSLVGRPLAEVVHEDDALLVGALLHGLASESRVAAATEWRISGGDGVWRTFDVSGVDLREDEAVEGLVLTLRDISQRKIFEEQLRHRAFHDPLTQLANRALFYDRVEHALSRDERDGQMVAVLYVDMDDLKRVNDRYGHAFGDDAILAVASRIRGCVRAADTAARLGGDEFGILLEGVGGDGEPVQLAERILAAMRDPVLVDDVELPVTVSIGIAVARGGETVDELLRAADLAMYAAKSSGKHRHEVFDADLDASVGDGRAGGGAEPDRIAWFARNEEQRAEILSVLERPTDLRMVVQPIVDVRTGRIAGYEALARFPGSDRRPPNAWFAQAHRAGVGPRLEALAVRRALELPGRPAGAYLSVNASPSALASPELMAVLPGRLDGIVVEVTENEIVGGGDEFLDHVRALRARGALLAVDDAGSGYAGLRQLVRLRPDLIKLDRSLVAGVHADATKSALIESFVRFASSIGAHVCAEGVEEIADLRALAEMDVTYAQGWVVGRPGDEWAAAAPAAAAVCARSFEEALQDDRRSPLLQTSERRLARIGVVVGEAADAGALSAAMSMIAAELGADDVQVSRLLPDGQTLLTLCSHTGAGNGDRFALDAYPETRRVLDEQSLSQVIDGDPDAEPSELAFLRALGQASLLMVPVVSRGTTIGLLEATRSTPRPWSRLEMGRARIVATQLVALVEGTDVPVEVPHAA